MSLNLENEHIYTNIFKLFIFWLVGLNFLVLFGPLTYGHGLGDLFQLAESVVVGVLIVFLCMFIDSKKSSLARWLGILVMVIYIVWYSLHVTFLRGPEYSWNGSIFM